MPARLVLTILPKTGGVGATSNIGKNGAGFVALPLRFRCITSYGESATRQVQRSALWSQDIDCFGHANRKSWSEELGHLHPQLGSTTAARGELL